MNDKQYENPNEHEEILVKSLAENFIYNIREKNYSVVTETDEEKHKKYLEDKIAMEILMEEYENL